MSSPRATPSREVVPGVKVNDQPPNPFDSLPIETVQQIAEGLDSDSALCAFQASCRSARDAVDGDNFSLWRRRFISYFEPTGWSQKENVKYKCGYHHRRRVLKNGATFQAGNTRREKECLELVKELVVGAFADSKTSSTSILTLENKPEPSKNIERLETFLESTNLLTTIFAPRPQKSRYGNPLPPFTTDRLLDTIRVICAPFLLSLEPHFINEHFGFPDSQQAVYSTVTTQPFFGGPCGLDINMDFVLHNINFWRYHMVRQVEQTLFTAFSELTDDERPQWWSSQLKQGSDGKMLGRYWKGSYAYLDPEQIARLRARSADDEDEQYQDIFAGEDAAFSFQDMELHAVEGKKMLWPQAFERHLKSLTPPPPSSPLGRQTRAQKKSGVGGTPEEVANFKPLSFRFDGHGDDSTEAFLASGWLNPLPLQQGIPGWSRLTMMKYYELDDDESAGAGVYGGNVDWDALWAYEGVVLPGGKIVVGRWWSPSNNAAGGDDEQYSGPFVLWCVDGAEGYRGMGVEREGEEEL